ncbi:hypothetical protein MPSEU_000593400 [Mayamaea pseudoterrestris]|nr:hypothetical protein MPSEU_000593400 [Mayamaea pseudoterrestris]
MQGSIASCHSSQQSESHIDDSTTSTGNGTSNASTTNYHEIAEARHKLFIDESKQVAKLKIVMICIMVLAAIAVVSTVYYESHQSQSEALESAFYSSAEKLLDTFHNIAQEKLGALSSLTVAATAHGVDTGSHWPFLSLSYFQHRAITTRTLSGALLITMNPLVTQKMRSEWESYSFNSTDAAWHSEGLEYESQLGYKDFGVSFDASHVAQRLTLDPDLKLTGLANRIFTLDDKGDAIIDTSQGPYLPTWQTSPVFIRTLVNRNLLTDPAATAPANESISTGSVVFGGFELSDDDLGRETETPETKLYTALLSIAKKRPSPYVTSPLTRAYLPIFDSFDEATKKPVALMTALIRWESYFVGILPTSIRGINMVLDNNCGNVYTFKINGHEPDPVGLGDEHDDRFHKFGRMATFADVHTVDDGSPDGIPLNEGQCPFQITAYPNDIMHEDYHTNMPAFIAFAVAMVFLFTFIMFLLYDRLVDRRQNLVLRRAEQTTAIVTSLFPKSVADKIIMQQMSMDSLVSKNQKLKTFLDGADEGNTCIADLFPACTVLYADIAGFTAWSSTRDPSQVFQLLESIYNSFDEIAKNRKVFKVETIGDCYVAVTGLPDPQANHAVIMARFASECLAKMNDVTRKLETILGPDTRELALRIGLHSGPVTAGVLRGDKSRFQLFGATVNDAARMESSGVKGRIQVSQDTANILVLAGKEHWLTPRDDSVDAVGKGVLKTFWLNVRTSKGTSGVSSGNSTAHEESVVDAEIPASQGSEMQSRTGRMVDWMTELLGDYLKQTIAKRIHDPPLDGVAYSDVKVDKDLVAIDEVVEAIVLPMLAGKDARAQNDWRSIEIDEVVAEQLRKYVSAIASMYRDNPFHNFAHACHVTMSVAKHLKRIVAPDIEFSAEERKAAIKSKGDAMAILHDYTHGINSDPLTHFAILFSGLVHDVDHRGISNAQLEKEEPAIAAHFKHQSLAEQNSLEIAWTLLQSPDFSDLRRCLFRTMEETSRFRQVIVNAVMATDIFDKKLNQLRKNRWEKAFAPEDGSTIGVDRNALRATIVLEHIIQASDVSHTMQHWHVYRKWNRLLFHELTLAYRSGKMAADPASFWYKGELGFFDGYIIPLAKKLKDCKVFGVSSDECLNYAMRNRAEWEVRGEEAVAEMVREFDDLADACAEERLFI